MIRVYALLALGIVLTLSVAAIYTRFGAGDRFAQCRTGIVAGESALKAEFSLIDQNGRRVTEADVLDTPALVYFGYTFCPDVCPIDAARNGEATALLDDMGKDVRPVFITVDPARDTAEVLSEFTENFHDDMVGLTGSTEDIGEAARNFRVYFKAHEAEDEYYLVDHTAFTYLTLPQEGVVEFFRRDTSPEDMAERTACFVDQA